MQRHNYADLIRQLCCQAIPIVGPDRIVLYTTLFNWIINHKAKSPESGIELSALIDGLLSVVSRVDSWTPRETARHSGSVVDAGEDRNVRHI